MYDLGELIRHKCFQKPRGSALEELLKCTARKGTGYPVGILGAMCLECNLRVWTQASPAIGAGRVFQAMTVNDLFCSRITK